MRHRNKRLPLPSLCASSSRSTNTNRLVQHKRLIKTHYLVAGTSTSTHPNDLPIHTQQHTPARRATQRCNVVVELCGAPSGRNL
ncbi:hypothetical protein H2248_010379 [Termitomyces sp. 'cryptogamus']|nr:hypothetical protein H2248_010379 [Termitomyces sp. 'cryptogamus']